MAYLERGKWRTRIIEPRALDCFHVERPERHYVLRCGDDVDAKRGAVIVDQTISDMDPSDEMMYRRAWACLGAITLQDVVYVVLVTDATIAGSLPIGQPGPKATVSRVTGVDFVPLSQSRDPLAASPFEGLRRILTNGFFYFFLDETDDLRPQMFGTDYDRQFEWNAYLRKSLSDRTTPFLRTLWQGHFGVQSFFSDSGSSYTMVLMSRLSAARAGTRLKSRGIDDDGNVANFCETRTVLHTDDFVVSFNQIRGSVPLFWEETATAAVTTKIVITRPQVASMPAFAKHFDRLNARYGEVMIVNLLADRGNEAPLKKAYRDHYEQLGSSVIAYEELDFHAENTVSPSALSEALSRLAAQHDNLLDPNVSLRQSHTNETVLLHSQNGIFRTNCKDCLDRTNVVQEFLSREALLRGLALVERPVDLATQNVHRQLFASNGDTLSRLYTGTGALSSAITKTGKKGDWKSFLGDAGKSLGRLYQNTFLDSDKQEGLDILLGLHRNLHSIETRTAHLKPYSGPLRDIIVWTSTYNVEGRSPTSEIRDWLDRRAKSADIVFIGLQEVVALTPRGVILPDEAKVLAWTSAITEVLSETEDPLLPMRSLSLVGTVGLLFVRTSLLPFVRDIFASSKKTGMGGTTGNKGAVAISMILHRTTFCFVAAHLAAGQEKADERSAESQVIRRELAFPFGFRIEDHEVVIWAADLNYRVDVNYDDAIDLVTDSKLDALLDRDQLRARMTTVFPEYQEGPISFKPTYKFDHGTDVYDTSEKRRIPAWTDRILMRTMRSGSIQEYYSCPIRLSDHRPVCASTTFEKVCPLQVSQTKGVLPKVSSSSEASEPKEWLNHIDYSKLEKHETAWQPI